MLPFGPETIMRRSFLAAIVALAAVGASAQTPPPAPKRDALLNVVECVNKTPGLKPSPQAPVHACNNDVVGVERYLALESFKMTGCPLNEAANKSHHDYKFTDALILPLSPVTGVEDSHRPDGIWSFAWKFAQAYIPGQDSVALVANPKTRRSQDQLHIHVMRLLPQAAEKIKTLKPEYIKSLEGSPDPVWAAAERHSHGGLESGHAGVAVSYDKVRRRFAVVTVDDSPEADFAVTCPAAGKGM
jgi:CDP-diacylglycerol pyrophosphatase